MKKILDDGIIMPFDFHFVSPVVLCRKNNGKNLDDPEGWKLAIDNYKLNAIVEYQQFPIPVIGEISVTIKYTNFTSTPYLNTECLQIPTEAKDIHETVSFKLKMSVSCSNWWDWFIWYPSLFQKITNKIFKSLLGNSVLFLSGRYYCHGGDIWEAFVVVMRSFYPYYVMLV